MKKEPVRILLTGGGSGGHVYPLLEISRALKKHFTEQGVSLQLLYFGPRDRYRKFFISEEVEVHTIIAGKYRRYFSLMNILDIFKFGIGLFQGICKMLFVMPDVIFSKGGPGALPVVLTGWFYRVPIIIHESDVVPGITNSISSFFARKILLSFEETVKRFPPKKAVYTGDPGRRPSGAELTSEEAKKIFNFDPKLPLTVFLGGSQGSSRLNKFVMENLDALLEKTQIALQTGDAKFREVEKIARGLYPKAAKLSRVTVEEKKSEPSGTESSPEEKPKITEPVAIQISPYLEAELDDLLRAASVVVSRAGSGALSTIAAFGKASILIPLPESANDHQRANAYVFEDKGAAIVLEESNLLPQIFNTHLEELLKNSEKRSAMGERARSFFNPEIPEAIAREIFALIRPK